MGEIIACHYCLLLFMTSLIFFKGDAHLSRKGVQWSALWEVQAAEVSRGIVCLLLPSFGFRRNSRCDRQENAKCWEGFHRLLVCPGCWKQSVDALSALTPTPVVLHVFVSAEFCWQLRLGLIYQEEGKAFVEPE